MHSEKRKRRRGITEMGLVNYYRFYIVVCVLVSNGVIGKIFDRCELANQLRYRFSISIEYVAVWVCIAHYQSGLNSSTVGYQADGVGYYGMFQISDQYWCSPPGNGKVCGISCYGLLDDDLENDLGCMTKIYEEHQRISGNGFNAWSVYPTYCSGDRSLTFVDGCFHYYDAPQNIYQRSVPSYNTIDRNSIVPSTKPVKNVGKVYDRCELALELYNQHKIPINEIATWVCIAQHESSYNTSAIGRLNSDGSEDHGLFQISDIYWCSPPGKGWACGLSCSQLEDNDISDDVECMKKIYAEHQQISGDGFNAWTVYPQHCKGRSEQYMNGCHLSVGGSKLPHRPAVTAPPSPTNSYQKTNVHRQTGKIYNRCELAQELFYKHNLPREQIATWVCIAQHESSYNTSAIGRLNTDGSEDHGLFQISDIYWCSPPGKGWVCGLSCAQLEDNDITDDVECMRKIYAEHQQISGDGFNAWTVYPAHCRGRSEQYISDCALPLDNNIAYNELVLPSPILPRYESNKPRGKVYERCELAHDLKNTYFLPDEQIATWVCIAHYESKYNTSAIGRLNADGSEDHGLFQVSDIYWCSPPGKGWACGLSCSDLEDNDITDDVECIKKIYAEHQRLSGDGFNAWSVYRPYCKNQVNKFIDDCGINLKPNKPHPAITSPPFTAYQSTSKLYHPYNEIESTTTNYQKSNSIVTPNLVASNYFLSKYFNTQTTPSPKYSQPIYNTKKSYYNSYESSTTSKPYYATTNAPSSFFDIPQKEKKPPSSTTTLRSNAFNTQQFQQNSIFGITPQSYQHHYFSQSTTTQSPLKYYPLASSNIEVMTKPQITTVRPRTQIASTTSTTNKTFPPKSTSKPTRTTINQRYYTTQTTPKLTTPFTKKSSTTPFKSAFTIKSQLQNQYPISSITIKPTIPTKTVPSTKKPATKKPSTTTRAMTLQQRYTPTSFTYTTKSTTPRPFSSSFFKSTARTTKFPPSYTTTRRTTPKSINYTQSTKSSQRNTKTSNTITSRLPPTTKSPLSYYSYAHTSTTKPSTALPVTTVPSSTVFSTKSQQELKFDLWFDQFKH